MSTSEVVGSTVFGWDHRVDPVRRAPANPGRRVPSSSTHFRAILLACSIRIPAPLS